MENKAIKILSICLVALFTLAVLFFAVGLIVEYKKAPGVIDSTLHQFTSDVDVASEYYTPGTQQFSDVLRARIASNKTIAVVTIAQGDNVIFAYPLSSPFITQSVGGQPTVTASSSFVKVKSNEIELGNSNYVITSALYSLQPAVIYSYIRISFLVILAGTLIAGIALMYLYLVEQKHENDNSFDDLGTAERLKKSKLDFPEVATEDSVNALVSEDFDLSEEDNQEFDENNLPAGALDFPPVDDTASTPDFVVPQSQQTGVVVADSTVTEADYPMSPVEAIEDFSEENEFVAQEEFFQEPLQESFQQEGAPREVDLTDIVENNFVAEDSNILGHESEPFALEDAYVQYEQLAPSNSDLENAFVAQAKFTQENLETPVVETEHFNIDKALQGYEPPQKPMVEPAYVANEVEGATPSETVASVPQPEVVVEPAYIANEIEGAAPSETVASVPQPEVVVEPAYIANEIEGATPSEPVAFVPQPEVVASEPTYVVNEVEGAAPSEPVASVPQPEVVASEPVNVNTEPAGLFSPVTGFGWEAYLEERLDSELIRSASSEEDIGLMIVRIQGIDRTDQRNKAIYNKLLEIYKFRDLIFEYGSDGFSCIVHSVNVDSALDLAEQVYVALSKILKENGMDNEIGIGISTRSFRLIPGKRIFEEAEQALIRAFTDPETAIVAFRVDPEKYRQYISNYIDQEE